MLALLIILAQPGPALEPAPIEHRPRPAHLTPSLANLLRADLTEQPSASDLYPARSPAVLGWMQRQLCAGDWQAQTLWSLAAALDPPLWNALPNCAPACEWAWHQGQRDGCRCLPIIGLCGSVDTYPSFPLVRRLEGCPWVPPDDSPAFADRLRNCLRSGGARHCARQLLRLEGWRGHELIAVYARPAMADFMRGITDGAALERALDAAGWLAPHAHRLGDRLRPGFSLFDAWRQVGQAVAFTADGVAWDPARAHLEAVAAITGGALDDVVFVLPQRACRAFEPFTVEAWAPDRVWRVQVTGCAELLVESKRLVNTILAARGAPGRIAGFGTQGMYYTPPRPPPTALLWQ